MKLKQLGMSTLGIVLLIVVLLLLVGAFPVWPYASGWGYGAPSLLGIVLIVLIILLVTGRL